MLKRCSAGRVYITAFLDIQGFRKYAAEITWETEVWIADNPGHMIHFNGPKFVGPYQAEGTGLERDKKRGNPATARARSGAHKGFAK